MGDGNAKREVLYIWPYLEWGGAQIYFIGLMKLARERYDVRALMPAGSAERLLGYMQALNIPCEFFEAHVDMSPARTLWEKLCRRWRKAYAELTVARYLGWRRPGRALLHVDFGPWSSFWLLLYLSLRSQVFVTLHTALPAASGLRRRLWKLKFRILCAMKSFHLLASNRDMIESLKPYVKPDLLQRIPLAYSGVDRSEIGRALEAGFDRAALCEKLEFSPDCFFVFAMGQFIERKGCWVLLEAARSLHELHPDICFVWIGTAQLDAETERLIAGYGLGEKFRLITSQEIGQGRAGLLALLRLADLFVLPSSNEGLPVALIEAMALGKACVASSVNAIPEAIRDRETGLLVKAGDSAALAAAIAGMKEQPRELVRLAAAGREFVLENFDERRTAQITVNLYDAYAGNK
jgi:glycosyltransferase involved in cell wall biosynthesis